MRHGHPHRACFGRLWQDPPHTRGGGARFRYRTWGDRRGCPPPRPSRTMFSGWLAGVESHGCHATHGGMEYYEHQIAAFEK